MRSFEQIRHDYAFALQADPNHGGAMQLDPRNHRFMQRAIDQMTRARRKPARRARGRAARKARAVNRG